MALEDFLRNLRSTQENFEGASKQFAEMGQTEDLSRSLRDLGSMGLQPHKESIARSLIASRDAKGLRDFIATENQPKIGQGFVDFMKAEGIQTPDALINGIANASNPEALEGTNMILDYTTQKKNRNALVGNAAETRRAEEQVQKQREKFDKTFNEKRKELVKEERDLGMGAKLLSLGNPAGDELAKVFVAKRVGGQGGVLTDQDLNRLQQEVFKNSLARMHAWVTGDATVIITPEQRLAMGQILKEAQSRFDGYRAQEIDQLARRALVYPKLIKDGEVDPSISEAFAGEGYKFEMKDGKPTASRTSTLKTKIPGGGDGADPSGLEKLNDRQKFNYQQRMDAFEQKHGKGARPNEAQHKWMIDQASRAE